MPTALRFTTYDFFRTELSVIQENLLGFLFRDHGFFCQRGDAYSYVTAFKYRVGISYLISKLQELISAVP